MREQTWLTTTDPEPMLKFIKGRASNRKCRLLVCATGRLTWDEIADERCRRAIEVGELYADYLTDSDTRQTALDAGFQAILEASQAGDHERVSRCLCALDAVFDTNDEMLGLCRPRRTMRERVRDIPLRLTLWWLGVGKVSIRRPTPESWCYLVRDIFGNPFRPVAFDPRWRTSDVVGLARAIYDDKAFERMPILADALMDAGCEDEQIISHCRGDGPHVRGCWVVDLILGKE